jgi:large repetitive protein
VVSTSGGMVTLAIASLGSGDTATVTVEVVPESAGEILNSVQVSGSVAGPDTGNNSADLGSYVTAIPGAPDGPRPVRLRRFGFHLQPTTLVVTFDAPLDAASAQNLENYVLIGPLPGRRVIPIAAADYDASKRCVKLKPARRLNVHDWYRYQLRVSGTSGGRIGRRVWTCS